MITHPEHVLMMGYAVFFFGLFLVLKPNRIAVLPLTLAALCAACAVA